MQNEFTLLIGNQAGRVRLFFGQPVFESNPTRWSVNQVASSVGASLSDLRSNSQGKPTSCELCQVRASQRILHKTTFYILSWIFGAATWEVDTL